VQPKKEAHSLSKSPFGGSIPPIKGRQRQVPPRRSLILKETSGK